MNDYEQMSCNEPGNLQNPFTKTKKVKGFGEIVKNKNALRKYFVLIGAIILLIVLITLSVVRSNKIASLKEQIEITQNNIKSIDDSKLDLTKKIEVLTERKNQLKEENDKVELEKKDLKGKILNVQETKKISLEGLERYQKLQDEIKKKLQPLLDVENEYVLAYTNLNTKINEIKEDIIKLKKQANDLRQLIKAFQPNDSSFDISNFEIKSNIITRSEEIKTISDWINILPIKSLNLLYRSSRDKYAPRIFHQRVDGYKNTLTLVKDRDGSIIGGFTTRTWDGSQFKEDSKAVIFNLTTKIAFRPLVPEKAIYADPSYLAVFGSTDICLAFDRAYSGFPIVYGPSSGKNELTGKEQIDLVEMEVFLVSFD